MAKYLYMAYVAMVRGRPVWRLPWKRLSQYIYRAGSALYVLIKTLANAG